MQSHSQVTTAHEILASLTTKILYAAPACEHNVKQFFEGSGKVSLELLKEYRDRWHEDRFASCREDLRPEFRRLANSLFVVLDPWHNKLKREQANYSSVG